jgi:hypothetical protein
VGQARCYDGYHGVGQLKNKQNMNLTFTISTNTILAVLWGYLLFKKLSGSTFSWWWFVLVSVVWGLT